MQRQALQLVIYKFPRPFLLSKHLNIFLYLDYFYFHKFQHFNLYYKALRARKNIFENMLAIAGQTAEPNWLKCTPGLRVTSGKKIEFFPSNGF